MTSKKRIPKKKLALVRSATLTAIIFAIIWGSRLIFSGVDYTPLIHFGNWIDPPVMPRFLDTIFAMPLGGLIGVSLAALRRLPESTQRNRKEAQTAERIKYGLLLAGLSGSIIAVIHMIDLDKPSYLLTPCIGLLLLIVALVALIPQPSEEIFCGLAGLIGLSFGIYAGMLSGIFLACCLVILFIASLFIVWLVKFAANTSSKLFTWTCGL